MHKTHGYDHVGDDSPIYETSPLGRTIHRVFLFTQWEIHNIVASFFRAGFTTTVTMSTLIQW